MFDIRLYIFPLMFFVGCWKVQSQNRIIQFQNISVENGISDNRVNNILQDKEGYLWISTRLGIDRYSGQSTKAYHLLKEHIEVNHMLQDAEGRVWAATTGGLYLFDRKKDQFEKWPAVDIGFYDLLDGNILDILQLDNGSFWCATASGRIVLFSIENGTGEIILNLTSDENRGGINYPTCLIQDRNCTIWMGTRQGEVLKYEDSKFTTINYSTSNSPTSINAIAMDGSDQLWIGTKGNGLFKYNDKNGSTNQYTRPGNSKIRRTSDNIVLSLLVDNDNNLWIGTDGGGLYMYSPKENEFTNFLYNRESSFPLADNSVLALYQGEDHVIWAGTVHGGVSFFKNNVNIRQIPPSDLAFTKADVQGSEILEASNGDIWLSAGRDGLRRYNPETQKVNVFIDDVDNNNDLNGDNILSLFEDDQRRIWIGTLNGGLNIYDYQSNKFLKAEGSLDSKATFAIQKDADGNIWVGSNSGIRVYDPGLRIIKKYTVETTPSLCSNVITCLYRDVKGDMWAGTALGLNVFKKDTVTAYHSIKDDPSTLSANRIVSIAEGDDLSVLIGTYGYGLSRYKRSTDNFERIGKDEGLEGNIIEGIFMDKNRNIWCSTDLGLSKISSDRSIDNFGSKDGVQVFRGGSAIINSKDEIVLGGPFGLLFIKPADLKAESPIAPKIFFTSVSLVAENGERNIPLTSKTKNKAIMGPDASLLTIEYSDSDFWNRNSDHYKYRLEGLNGVWQPVGDQQLITFSNLPPGDYTLEVGSTKNYGNDIAKNAVLDITVLPSFWQKSWVHFFIAILFCSLLIALYKWRLSINEKQHYKLQKLVATKTKEVKKQQEEVYQTRISLLNAEKENQNLNQDRLKDELNFKTEELTNITLRTIQKNHLLTEIKGKLLEEPNGEVSDENLKNIIELIDDSLTFDKDWEHFYHLFNQTNPTFIKNLKTQTFDLSDREIRLCALIKLNFKSEHIATLFGISLSSVKVARHRLRKKMNIQENDNFQDFFNRLL